MGLDMHLMAPSATAAVPAIRKALALVPRGSARVYDGRIVVCNGRMTWPDFVEVDATVRYFGNGITSGHWPTIRAVIVAVRPHAPGLRYGHDQDSAGVFDLDGLPFFGELVTNDLIAREDANWAAWILEHPERA